MLAWSGSDSGLAKLLHDPRWSIDDIEWRLEVPERTTATLQRRLAGHLLAGERLAGAICLRLIDVSGSSPARAGLLCQVADERRHEAAFTRYLELLGYAPEAEDAFSPAVEAVATWRGPPAALLVAGHVLLEGDAIDATGLLRDFPCRLLARLCRLVAQDEARHVAFGRALLAAEIRNLDRAARLEIYAWARRAWMQSAALTLPRFGGATWLAHASAAALWQRHHRRLVAVGLLA
jgi:hypothetical protein